MPEKTTNKKLDYTGFATGYIDNPRSFDPESLRGLNKIGYNLLKDNVQPVVALYNKLVDFKKSRPETGMTSEELDFRERMVKAQMFSYPNSIKDLRTFADNVYNNKSQSWPGSSKPKESRMASRRDLVRFYYGLPNSGKTLTESAYKPSVSTDSNSKYYDFKNRNEYVTQLKNESNFDYLYENIVNPPQTSKEINKRKEQYINKTTGKMPISFYDADAYFTSYGHLGMFKRDVGEDTRGRYISFYDKWDIDPPILKKHGIEVDNLNNPFEIYTRIYEDEIHPERSKTSQTFGREPIKYKK